MKLSFLLLFCIPLFAYSQEGGYLSGYVITNKGDTLLGLVKHINGFPYQILYREIKFKDEDGKHKTTFTPETIKEFKNDGDNHKYISKSVDGSKEKDFVAVFVDDYLSYYELIITTGPGRSSFEEILEKKNDSTQFTYEASSVFGGFKKNIVKYLSDDTELCEKITNGTYNRSDIRKIVKEYNSFRAALQGQ